MREIINNDPQIAKRFKNIKHFDIYYGKRFVLLDSNDKIIPQEKAYISILKAFLHIADKFPEHFPVDRYNQADRPHWIGISFYGEGKTYLIPSFNGNGITHLKCEFTSIIEHDGKIVTPPNS